MTYIEKIFFRPTLRLYLSFGINTLRPNLQKVLFVVFITRGITSVRLQLENKQDRSTLFFNPMVVSVHYAGRVNIQCTEIIRFYEGSKLLTPQSYKRNLLMSPEDRPKEGRYIDRETYCGSPNQKDFGVNPFNSKTEEGSKVGKGDIRFIRAIQRKFRKILNCHWIERKIEFKERVHVVQRRFGLTPNNGQRPRNE